VQVDLDVRRDHERVSKRAAPFGEGFEPCPQEQFGRRRLEELELRTVQFFSELEKLLLSPPPLTSCDVKEFQKKQTGDRHCDAARLELGSQRCAGGLGRCSKPAHHD